MGHIPEIWSEWGFWGLYAIGWFGALVPTVALFIFAGLTANSKRQWIPATFLILAMVGLIWFFTGPIVGVIIDFPMCEYFARGC